MRAMQAQLPKTKLRTDDRLKFVGRSLVFDSASVRQSQQMSKESELGN